MTKRMLVFDTESDGLATPKVKVYESEGKVPSNLSSRCKIYKEDWGIKVVEPPATKFHIFGWTTDGKEVHTSADPADFLSSLEDSKSAWCHNAFTHDFPLIKNLLGYNYQGLVVDTLWLSWYLWPNRPKHGLESFEQEAKVKKVQVDQDQWAEGDYELMKARVTNDVLLNWWVAQKQKKLLEEMYSGI